MFVPDPEASQCSTTKTGTGERKKVERRSKVVLKRKGNARLQWICRMKSNFTQHGGFLCLEQGAKLGVIVSQYLQHDISLVLRDDYSINWKKKDDLDGYCELMFI